MSKKAIDLLLDRDKLEIIKWVTTLKDRALVDTLKMLKENPKRIDWWDGISDNEKKSIEMRNLKLEK